MQTLQELYRTHTGKVSDKWSFYLDEYDRLFQPYRNQPVRLLEIGIQNGGSLEVWSKYFAQAEALIGCDINPDCAQLQYEDQRIHVIVGDANAAASRQAVQAITPKLDLLIDDGSHVSGDIIESFLHYFPMLEDGGLYVAEDLHCSYWQEFDGGLFDTASSIAFFKALADIVNHEHWGVGQGMQYVLSGMAKKYGLDFSSAGLEKVHSVEFVNSVCVIRKQPAASNQLGRRQIVGQQELVMSVQAALNDMLPVALGQEGREWSINSDMALAQARAQLEDTKAALQASENVVNELVASRSWRLTYPLRWSLLQARKMRALWRQCQAFLRSSGGFVVLMRKALRQQEHTLPQLAQISIARASSEHLPHELMTSTSWKLTSPWRWLGDALRGGRGLAIPVATEGDPEPELARPPATMPAFELLSGLVPYGPMRDTATDCAKLIAFYLPQYHRISENAEWWGPGFTEWTNVVKGRPNYDGHYQPHLPRELGFYDLSSVEVMREQAEMAKLYGIGAFCFYYYWFSGRRILERPIDNFLNSDINFDYCLCWANENWTRTWDGDTRSVLMRQEYLDADPQEFIASLLPHFSDRRYIRVDGKPLLVVYRAKDIPDTSRVFEIWRQAVEGAGFPGLHIAVVDFYDISRPDEVGADALVEFPPHKFNGPQCAPEKPLEFTNRDFRGGIVDYAKVVAQSANRQQPDFTLYRGVLPSWDNTARRQSTPTILHGSSPELFGDWLRYVRAYTRDVFDGRPDPFIFVNAWNEWGEGCHLEPDQKWGLSYLEALKASEWFDPDSTTSDSARRNLLSAAAVSIVRRDGSISSAAAPELGGIRQILEEIRPAKGTVQRIAFALRDYPLAHRVGKVVYSLLLVIRGR